MIEDELLVDVAAERQLLAVAIKGNTEAFDSVPSEAFTNAISISLASAIRTALSRNVPVDLPNIVRIACSQVSRYRGEEINRIAIELYSTIVAGGGHYYAERLRHLHLIREIRLKSETFKNRASYAVRNDDPLVLNQAVADMRNALDETAKHWDQQDTALPISVGDLLAVQDDPYDWLIPGLMERGDRLIVTGFEGTGKSYLVAQLALCVGAAIHPFTQEPIPPRDYRVLVLDAENSERQIRRRYRGIVAQLARVRTRNDLGPVDWRKSVRLDIRPEGFDLTDARELAWVTHAIESTAPDLVVAGPLYKMTRLNVQEEQAAQELTLTLDGLRSKYGFALICEAHAGHSNDGGGHRKVRPIGSSLFLRWPEFGFGLIPHPDSASMEHPDPVLIRHWRGSREVRDWPDALKHGDFLPWEPFDDSYYAKVRSRGV